jgi:drug/metabolite transporter (DMT)-like permease
VAPLAYLQVVTCVGYDVTVFGVALDALTVIGIAVIVGAGAYTTGLQRGGAQCPRTGPERGYRWRSA